MSCEACWTIRPSRSFSTEPITATVRPCRKPDESALEIGDEVSDELVRHWNLLATILYKLIEGEPPHPGERVVRYPAFIDH
jgi:hypothetical protein